MFYKTILFASTREKVQQKVQKPPPTQTTNFENAISTNFTIFLLKLEGME